MSASVIGTDRAAVDRLGHHEAGDEADGVEEGDEEYEIGGEAVEKCDELCRLDCPARPG